MVSDESIQFQIHSFPQLHYHLPLVHHFVKSVVHPLNLEYLRAMNVKDMSVEIQLVVI